MVDPNVETCTHRFCPGDPHPCGRPSVATVRGGPRRYAYCEPHLALHLTGVAESGYGLDVGAAGPGVGL